MSFNGFRVMLLSWKLKGGEEKWTASDDLRLIECFNEDEELEDEEDVDWERLAADWPRSDHMYYYYCLILCFNQCKIEVFS